MPNEAWYAPSLASPNEAGVQGWPRKEIVALLKNGVSTHASVGGPMAEVVYTSTQHLSEADVQAMASFLESIPVREHYAGEAEKAAPQVLARGGKLYDQNCASCHGDNGQGVPSIYPALAGNRAVTLDSPNNVVQFIRKGGFSPSTSGNPRPFGMPPFGQDFSNEDVAAVATYIRQSWGNNAAPVSPREVLRIR